ncbi:MAG: hypothetical protein JRG97_02185 [Deltaproteobacteria bacterium]|nr:hypothetical protein [Deltaproteobacteria bacterium]MBW2051590.1 hypothetical protein [Deltaproteobacteria bacterium]MBW2139866.1 hypothetical protein [Deltaproteobacteria bacterium]MBW2324744.1 hypothetical protein [Deltaproteobacteria bacterium]
MGLIARGVEEAGITTVYLGSCLDIMDLVKAPRMVFVDFPLGRQCGKPNDVKFQMNIIKDTLKVLETAQTPGQMVELPYEWGELFDWESFRRDVAQMIQEEGIPSQDWKPKK